MKLIADDSIYMTYRRKGNSRLRSVIMGLQYIRQEIRRIRRETRQ